MSTDTPEAITAELPRNRFNDRIRDGHLIRTGHKLDAYLVYDGGGIWHAVRRCCPDTSQENTP